MYDGAPTPARPWPIFGLFACDLHRILRKTSMNPTCVIALALVGTVVATQASAQVVFYETGHFALETHSAAIGAKCT